MNQVVFNSIKQLVKKNENDYLLFEVNKLFYLIRDGKVYNVDYVNDLGIEVQINRNDQAFKVYIDRVEEVVKLYKAYRTKVLYWTDFEKEGASRKFIDQALRALLDVIGDNYNEISDLDDYLREVDLEVVLKSLEDHLILF